VSARSASGRSTAADRLLIVSTGAGSVTRGVEAHLRSSFPNHRFMEFDPRRDLRRLVTADGMVVVAGGDGTVGFALRALAGTNVRIGILPLGTYNNFARSLDLPEDVDGAIEVVRRGRVHLLTLGRVNGRPFLEAAALGLFGEVIALGEAAKDRAFGELPERLRVVSEARSFAYRLTGDLDGSGSALSLVFANTPTTGARLEVGDATPEDPYLTLSVGVAERRSDLLSRMLAATLRHGEPPASQMSLHFRKLTVRTRPRVPVYADNEEVGRSPVTVQAEPGAVRVVVPG
jgi:diacylglycerol kinase family enzyme